MQLLTLRSIQRRHPFILLRKAAPRLRLALVRANKSFVRFNASAAFRAGSGRPERIASRMRCPRNHALLSVQPSVRCNWSALMPFLLDAIRKIACSQSCSGMWLDSKIVPTLTVNGLRQCSVALVRADPRALAAQGTVGLPVPPQCGRIGPRRQTRASTKR